MQVEAIKKISAFTLFFIITCSVVVGTYFVRDLMWRAEVVATGGISELPLEPYYGFFNLKSEATAIPKTEGALGLDFSQVYFAAKAMADGEDLYDCDRPKDKDPFCRKSAYPPLTHWLYIPITGFAYWSAVILHNFGTLALFSILTAYVLWQQRLSSEMWKVFLLIITLYFYTPLGFSHFERGQFEIFSACAYLLLYFSLFYEKHSSLSLFFSGIFSALKITSLPALGSVSFIAMLGAPKKRRWLFLLPLVTVAATIAVFGKLGLEYAEIVSSYETLSDQNGVTFTYFLPSIEANFLQIFLLIIFSLFFYLKTNASTRLSTLQKISLPFALAMTIQGMCIGTYNFEYRIVSLLGLIPALVIWNKKAGLDNHIMQVTACLFAIFTVVSFRTFYNFFGLTPVGMSAFYLVFSLLFLFISVVIVITEQEKGHEAS